MKYRKNPEVSISSLPTDIDSEYVIETAFGKDIAKLVDYLSQGNNVLVECDKQLIMPTYSYLRSSLQDVGLKSRFNAGASVQQTRCPTCNGVRNTSCGTCAGRGRVPLDPPLPLLTSLVRELTNWIREGEEKSVIIMPHLDLLTTKTGGLTDMARELIIVLYENPDARILAFKDPSFVLPETLSKLFPINISLIGTPRNALAKLITQNEARKFGVTSFDPFHLYKYVSGLNPIRLRQVLELVLRNKLDYDPNSPSVVDKIYKDIRSITCESLEIPQIDLWKDIGGYDDVKERIQLEIIDLIKYLDTASSVDEIKEIENLIPKGIILEGPPGTGKTFFAKAIATAINATVIVINGPEILSKWVGESEQNIRTIFDQARKSAPSIIIFDEIDSIASARTHNSENSVVRNSVVNQLLTELDGFRKDELVFIVGTTNFAESLDPALRRPGRFELIIEVPYPNDADRFKILNIYNSKYKLNLSEDALKYLVRRTSGYFDITSNSRYAGDHLQSICRNLKRILVRKTTTKQKPVLDKDDIDSIKLLRGDPESTMGDAPKVDLWNDIGGYKDIKQILQEEIIDQINQWQKMQDDPTSDPKAIKELERIIPKGIILEGPPGTGKTFFAKALATAIGARVIVVNGPEIVSMWVGKSEENLRQIFNEARRDAPSVIVFDEMDSFAGQRTASQDGGSRHANALVNQLLTEMDGFNKKEMVFVIGTTNFAESLDNALRRPGRFEFALHIPYPKAEDRKEIFGIYNKKFNLGLSEDQIRNLVSRTSDYFDADSQTKYSGDHIEGVCRELRRIQLKKQRSGRGPDITDKDIDKVRLLHEYIPTKISVKDRRLVAIHEAGHTLVSALLEDAPNPHKVSIADDEDSIAPFYTQFYEDKNRLGYSRKELFAMVAVSISGKMTEELFLGGATTGIYDDLMKASYVAREMIEKYGMGSFKQSLYEHAQHGIKRRQLSSQQEALIDAEVEALLGEAQNVVRNLLLLNRDALDALIAELLDKNELDWRAIEQIINAAKKNTKRYYRN